MTTLRLDAITKTLIGVVATGFLAWAGVVWDAREDLVRMRENIAMLRARVDALERHAESRWHAKAGEAIAELNARIVALEGGPY